MKKVLVMPNRRRCYIKIFLVIVVLLVAFAVSIFKTDNIVVAGDTLNGSLSDSVNDQLKQIDLSDFDKIVANMGSNEQGIFSSNSFLDKVKDVLSGKTEINFSSVLSAIFSLLSGYIVSVLPLICAILGIGILSSIITQTSYAKDKTIADIIHFVCYGIIITLVFASTAKIIKITNQTLTSIRDQMEIGFPILLTLMTAIGSNVSVGVYQPVVAILSGSVMTIFSNFVMPLFIFCLVFTVAGNLSNDIKLNRFSALFQNIFKWTIGFVFTLFSAFLVVQGVTAGSFDGLSVRTTKYAIKSYVPFVGSYLADGLNLILTSSILIKNSVGMVGLILLIITMLSPVLNILILKLCLSLSSSILEPLCDKRICNFLSSTSKCLSMLVATICSVGFAYLITVGLIMCTGNVT